MNINNTRKKASPEALKKKQMIIDAIHDLAKQKDGTRITRNDLDNMLKEIDMQFGGCEPKKVISSDKISKKKKEQALANQKESKRVATYEEHMRITEAYNKLVATKGKEKITDRDLQLLMEELGLSDISIFNTEGEKIYEHK